MKALWLSRLVKLERAQDGDNWELGSGLSSLLKGHEAAAALDPDWEPSDLDLEARALAGNAMAGMLAFPVKTRNFVRRAHPRALDETSTLINLCL